VQPDIAVFGEKDYQQLAVIRQLVQDLAMPINIIGAPLIRDADGMALSSRNRYLSEEERKRARSISQALFSIQKSVQENEHDIHELRKLARDVLKVDELDYLEFIDPINLTPVKKIYAPIRLLIAAWIGRTRLIDNILLEP
jgi:pantoate--beta-alanine ligase